MESVTVIYGHIIFEDGRAVVKSISKVETISAEDFDACEGIAEHNSGFYGGDWLIPELYAGDVLYTA